MFNYLLSRFKHKNIPAKPFSLNFLDDAFVQDPYPTFAWLREHEPLYRTQSGLWILTRYQDIHAAFSHPSLGNCPSAYSVLNHRRTKTHVCASVANNIIPFLDAPVHPDIRRIIARSFFIHLRFCSSILTESVQLTLHQLSNKHHFDVIHDFGSAYAIRVMCRLLGFDEIAHEKLSEWSDALVYLFSQMPSDKIRQKVDAALTDFRLYCLDLIRQRLQHPQNDWLTTVLQTAPNMPHRQVADHAMLLFADGLENIDRVIGSALWLLLRHPEQLALLKTQPKLWLSAVDECLRYETPAQFVGRTVQQDCTLLGQPLKKNHVVLLILASANRDPSYCVQPDQFSITREKKPQLTFGRGVHTCLGKVLARDMIIVALRALLDKYDDLILTETPHWTARIGHRWLAGLSVTVKR